MLRTRRIFASVLAVLTAVLLLLSNIGWWADSYFLNSERFADKAHKILDQDAVQQALAVAITDEISNESGTDLRIAQPFITTIVREVVRSGQFEDVFDAAVERLHHAVVSGEAESAVLNLSRIVDRIRNAIEPISPSLADNIPSGEKVRVRILDRTQLDTIYDAVNLVENLIVAMTILTIVCFAAALWVSPRRWRTFALTGWVVLGLFVLQLLGVRIGRGIVGGFPKRAEYSDAAESAYKVITRGLVVQAVVFAVLGLLVALGAGWTDRHGGWAAVKDVYARSTTWIKASLKKPAPAPALATADGGAVDGEAVASVATDGTDEETGTRAVVGGLLAPRLPAPAQRPRTAHWWRAAGLLVLGLLAVFSPGSLTTLVVVLLGFAALYLALTETIAAFGSPREPKPTLAPTEPADSAEA